MSREEELSYSADWWAGATLVLLIWFATIVAAYYKGSLDKEREIEKQRLEHVKYKTDQQD